MKAYKSREKQYYNNEPGKDLRKKFLLNADGISIKTEMIVHPKEESSMWWLQQLETTGDRQLTVGRTGRVVGMMSMSEVGDDRECLRQAPTGLGMVGQAHAALEMPWQQPWNPHALIGTASAELQWRDHNDEVAIPDEPQRWGLTEVVSRDRHETQPGHSYMYIQNSSKHLILFVLWQK